MSGRQQFEIVLKGRLGPAVTGAFPGFQIVSEDSTETRLRGWVADQSALHGVLERLRGLGIELTSVQQVNDSP